MKTLRDYQQNAIKGIHNWYKYGNKGHPLVVAPVGSGKSLIIAEFIRDVHSANPNAKIVMLTHVKELLQQNMNELLEQYINADTGFYCAGLNQKRLNKKITYASIQSVYKKAANFPQSVDIIIIDECHLIPHNTETQYRRFINDCININPNCCVIGFTGTPFRADSGRLDEGDNKLFSGVAYEIDIAWMIENGYLTKPITPKKSVTQMDVSNVKMRGGDFLAGELQTAIDMDEVTKACVDDLIEHGRERNKWIVFTAGVLHCEHVCDEIRRRGVSVDYITGETLKEERDKIISDFRDGKIKCLVNVAVLTTGFNVPDIDLVSFMRPTRSPVLYIQCIGRGIRPVYAEGFNLDTKEGRLAAIKASKKQNCLLLDYGGVVDALGPIDQVDIKQNVFKVTKKENEEQEEEELIVKTCPQCGALCMPRQKYCFDCSYCFFEVDLDFTAATQKAVVSTDTEPFEVIVIDMFTKKHQKAGKKPTLQVTYFTTQGYFNEWVCFEHTPFSYPHDKAVQWHKETGVNCQTPFTVDEAMCIDYPCPSRIKVKKDGKWYRVLEKDYSKLKELEMTEDEKYLASLDDIPF